ncbi:aspartate aminotransferase family protein [Phreatobacter oligotrophus]|uniref:Acetylornithine aminotransferase n=1 Tax=Phreatobacter oligotrophus TaxID=1122261 RepID=A0A2T4Z3A8_9HYPH|nr:aspartate aminotransferase family protein [Phreatobacter oligotrophus]PTM55260.1 acetylornithine/N-succinyldiaminopimelate aminotransferase [Phreatobacter oligotrophus]
MITPLMPNYARTELAFERGEGCWLVTADGRRVLDFGAGIAVNALGHSHPHLVAALTEQAQKLWHVSNLHNVPAAEKLAKRLTEATFADSVLFCNSGAEANEGAIKMARKYHAVRGEENRYRIITFEGAFHGRTLATIAAGGQKKYLEGFGPKVEGFDQVPFGDRKALEATIGPDTAALLIEPIQGEGGLRTVPTEELRYLRELCDKHGLLLIFDEVQTGVGRTGKLFAHEWAGVSPDIMAIAKGIGGGFPMGAVLAVEKCAAVFTPGTHGTTFGGNPLAAAVGNAVLDVVLAPGFLEEVQRKALVFKQKLAGLVDQHPKVFEEVRGFGLLTGLKCVLPNGDVTAAARREGLLVVPAGDNVIRLIPPLVVSDEEIDTAVGMLERAAKGLEASLVKGAAE